MNVVREFIVGVDLRNGHDGLKEVIKKQRRVDVAKLKPGEFVMCINNSTDAYKLFAANNYVCHYKHPRGILNVNALKNLHLFFEGNNFSYDNSLKAEISKFMKDYAEAHPSKAN
jgi:hypothetical protein